jgi:hypothetical protein
LIVLQFDHQHNDVSSEDGHLIELVRVYGGIPLLTKAPSSSEAYTLEGDIPLLTKAPSSSEAYTLKGAFPS